VSGRCTTGRLFRRTRRRALPETAARRPKALFVEVRDPIREIVADRADNMFPECAVAADAQVIVSGDKHLLDLGTFRGVATMSLAEFVEWTASG
jgi:predicted nucleic acid-binding protein